MWNVNAVRTEPVEVHTVERIALRRAQGERISIKRLDAVLVAQTGRRTDDAAQLAFGDLAGCQRIVGKGALIMQ